MRRVVVTGVGVICGIGRNRCEFQQALREGRSGVRPLTATDCLDLRFRDGAEVSGYNPADHFSLKDADMIDRFAQFAVVAAPGILGNGIVELSVITVGPDGRLDRLVGVLAHAVGAAADERRDVAAIFVDV